jgi:hypothetical protein
MDVQELLGLQEAYLEVYHELDEAEGSYGQTPKAHAAYIALDTTFEELMEINYQKLSARYPEGTFDVHRSENRVVGDI